jgi:hypothetical protein
MPITSRLCGCLRAGTDRGRPPRRNGPCPCGSGNKAKRCCYGNEQLFDNELVPAELCADVISDLAGTSKVEMQALFDRILYLPELDLSLQVPLPLFHTPHLDRAIRALNDEEDEVFDQKLVHVVPLVATAEHRWRSPGQWSRCETKAYSKKACRTGGSRTRPTDLDPLHLLGR